MANLIEARSDILKVHGELRWTIQGIRERLAAAEPDDEYVSPEFVVSNAVASWPGSQKEYVFKLAVYLKGEEAGNPNYISLFLQSHSRDADILVSSKLFLVKACGSKFALATLPHFFKKNAESAGYGVSNFYARAKLEANTDGVVSDDGAVTIGCDLDIIIPHDYVLQRGPLLQTDGRSSILGKRLYSERKDNAMTDLTLMCDERRFPCHKLILSAQSSFFNDMFKHAKENDREKDLVIEDIKPEVLEKMLEYIYTENVGDPAEHARELFVAADKFNIPGLKRLSGHALVTSLTADNVADVIMLLDVHCCTEEDDLMTAACRFAAQNMSAVLKTDSWSRVVTAHKRAVDEVFKAVAYFQGDKQQDSK